MRKIAIINQKGGVGKTTTAVNLGAALARAGQRVMILDMDPQAHATLHLSAAQTIVSERSLYNVLAGEATLAEIRQQLGERLWVAGAHIDLAAVEIELAGVSGRETILKQRLAADREDFDYAVIDCPPSLGVLTINALAAVDEVIIPLQPHFLALHGLGKLLETIQLISRLLNPTLKLTGVLLCLYEGGTRLASEVAHDVDQFLGLARQQQTPWAQARVFQAKIRRNIRLAEAPSFGQSIFEYAADSHGAEDYQALALELLAIHGVEVSAAAIQVPRRRARAIVSP